MENVSLSCSSHMRIDERNHGPRLLSRPLATPQHHVGVLARSLPEVPKCCGVVQRQPEVAGAIIEATSGFQTGASQFLSIKGELALR